MNDRQAGAKREREARDLLDSSDHVRKTWKPGKAARFIGPGRVVSQSQDIFEAFDLAVIFQDGRLGLVQVTSIDSGATSRRRRKIEDLAIDPALTWQAVFGRIARKGWRIWIRRTGDWYREDLPLHEPISDHLLKLNRIEGGR